MMPDSKQDLPIPGFSMPPVSEVALSVAFDPLEKLQVPQLGLLWQTRFRERFPRVEEHPPIEPAVEPMERKRPEFSVSFDVGPPPPRLWFLESSGADLLQLQRNWFARNWRKVSQAQEYPRYTSIRSTFIEDFRLFTDFITEEKLGEVGPTQCELTYVNHVFPGETWTGHGQLPAILKFLSEVPSNAHLPAPEQLRLAVQWLMTRDGTPNGRLHLNVSPAYAIEGDVPIYVLTLTARGYPAGQDLDGIMTFMDQGHRLALEAFEAVTTEDIQREWGKLND